VTHIVCTRVDRIDNSEIVESRPSCEHWDGTKFCDVQFALFPDYVKCRFYIYMDETFTLQLARASGI
jgi:hypothetical protein